MKRSRANAGQAIRRGGCRLTNCFRFCEACSRRVIQAMQAQAAGVQALHRLPVIGALDRVAERVHGGRMLGQDQQQRQQEALDHANGADVDAEQGRMRLMKPSCSIGCEHDRLQVLRALPRIPGLTYPAGPGTIVLTRTIYWFGFIHGK